MSVHVTLCGRLGNNLFQYALGRIIAERHGFALTCTQLDVQPQEFMGEPVVRDPSATLTGLTAYFPAAPLHMAGRRHETPTQVFEIRPDSRWDGHRLNVPAILEDDTPRRISLFGFFQRYEYYAPHRASIRRWLLPRPMPAPYAITPRDVVVSIRRGVDYGLRQWTLSLDYYDRLLSAMKDRGNVYVCGTGIDDTVRHRLEKYRPIEYGATAIEQFCFMLRFNRMVLSNSTFAWWAAFLSSASEVHAPRSPDGIAYGFTGYRDVDLHTREANYIEVRDVAVCPFGLVTPGAPEMVSACVTDLDPDARDQLAWVVSQATPVTLTGFRRRFPGADAAKTLSLLVKRHLLTIDRRYAE